MDIHQIHKYYTCADWALSEFSAAWNQGILGRIKYMTVQYFFVLS